MVRTRVGYAGGHKQNPSYYSLGDHTETVQVDFDPAQTSYEKILAVFWATPNLCAGNGSRQYMSAIFYHNEAQKKLALESQQREQARRGQAIPVAILPVGTFTVAEDYHQKYYLRQHERLMREFEAMYPNARDFRESTAAARVNSYLCGQGSREMLAREIDQLRLSADARQILRRLQGRGR